MVIMITTTRVVITHVHHIISNRMYNNNGAMVQVDLDILRELAWSGTPADLRPLCWQLLLGYLPPNRDRRYAAASAHIAAGESLCIE